MLEDQKENADSYNRDPNYYEAKFKKHFQQYALPDAERFISELKGKKILDVGCGPGVYLDYFREKELDALGIDLSNTFLDRCESKGLNVRKMDMEQPLLYPYSFDGIWATAAILHVPRERVPKLIETWAKLLKPRGLLWVTVKEGEKEGFEPAENGDSSKRWFTYFTEDELKKIVGTRFDVVYGYKQVTDNQKTWIKYLFRLKPAK